ncbi:MAG: OmpA family protein [Pseudomonadota bacterium]
MSLLAFALAGCAAFGVAIFSADRIEERSVETVRFAMLEEGFDWIDVSADGLQLVLEGTAPDEAARFLAISRAVSLVDGDRIVDRLDVVDPASFTAPSFALEMLRNDDGISLIGLVPEAGSFAFATEVPDFADGAEVVQMVETANYPVPDNWNAAVEYGLRALRTLPRAKVSVTEGRVDVEAVSRSPEERAQFVTMLERAVPADIEVVLDISAPRPVITPFTLRFVRDESNARFEACSADTEAASARIVAAAQAAGLAGEATCDIGLGIPSPRWTDAVELSLAATVDLGTATVTFSDADITLIAAEDTDQDLFDRVIGELDAALPAVFSLHGVLPDPSSNSIEQGPPSFTAELAEDGQVELRGRVPDARIETAIEAFASAEFGNGNVLLATRRVDDLPAGWSVRVLAGLSALSHLSNGSVRIEPGLLRIDGETGSTSAVSEISRLLGEQLGEAANFEIDVAYVEALDPANSIPTDVECVTRIDEILSENKITFEPGSIDLDDSSFDILDRIADVLPDCRHVDIEIGGHTDAQGRESMNLRLSQGRADAVLNGLMARNILIGNLSARGYGESRPIADNGTEAGREINRRIEFRLMSEIAAEEAQLAAEAEAAERANWPTPFPRPDIPEDLIP